MSSQSHNAKKPKLAMHAHSAAHDQVAALLSGSGEAGEPAKHKMSFAQHQHEQQTARTAEPMPAPVPDQHLKADAQQHQQKTGGRK